MIKRTAILLIGATLLVSVLTSGCTFNLGNSTPTASPTKTFESANFTIQYPSDWTKDVPKSGALAVLFGLPTNNATENLNVQVYNRTASDTLESLTNEHIQEAQEFENFTQIEAGNTTLAGNPANKIVYKATYDGDYLKVTQIWTVKDGKIYLITYKAAPDNYDTYLGAAKQMIDSFKIK